MNIQAQTVKFRFTAIAHETDNFSWDFTRATDEQVLQTAPISQDTINALTEKILPVVKPSHRAKLREQIAYLIALRHRQGEAWENYLADCEARTNNCKQWVKSNAQ